MSKIIHEGVEKVEIFVRFSWYKDDFTSDFMGVALVLEDLFWPGEKWVEKDDGLWNTDGDRPDTIVRFLRRHWMTGLL